MPTATKPDVIKPTATKSRNLTSEDNGALRDAEQDDLTPPLSKDAKAREEDIAKALQMPSLLLSWLRSLPQSMKFSERKPSATYVFEMYLAHTAQIECCVFPNWAKVSGADTVQFPFWVRHFIRTADRDEMGGHDLIRNYVELLEAIVSNDNVSPQRAMSSGVGGGRKRTNFEVHTKLHLREVVNRHMD